MLYRICDQLVILVRFRHLNGNLKLAGSGDGINLWSVSWCHGGVRHWLYQGDGIDLRDMSWGRPTGSGWWNRFVGVCHGDARHWLDRGWDWFMGTCDTGWIGAMELFHEDWGHWLERGNGFDLWRCVALTGMGWWDWFKGACHGGTRHWLDQGDGIDLWGCAVGHATRAGSGRWDWFMGIRHGGTRLDRGDGIDLWGHTFGVRHWLGHVMGARDWIRDMGLICGGTPWGCDTGWMWVMRLIYAVVPWGRATGSGRWNWFVEVNHGGARHWLDLGEGIDLCGRVMRARDTGGVGAKELIHGSCRMTKYYMVAEFE